MDRLECEYFIVLCFCVFSQMLWLHCWYSRELICDQFNRSYYCISFLGQYRWREGTPHPPWALSGGAPNGRHTNGGHTNVVGLHPNIRRHLQGNHRRTHIYRRHYRCSLCPLRAWAVDFSLYWSVADWGSPLCPRRKTHLAFQKLQGYSWFHWMALLIALAKQKRLRSQMIKNVVVV